MKIINLWTILMIIVMMNSVLAVTSVSDLAITTPSISTTGDIGIGGNLNITGNGSMYDLTVRSGQSITLAGATFENKGHYTSINTNWIVEEDDQPSAFLGVFANNGSVQTNAHLALEALNSSFVFVKNSPLHPLAPSSAGIINEDGNFGTFVEHLQDIIWFHYDSLTKDAYGNIITLIGAERLMTLNDTGLILHDGDLSVNGSMDINGILDVNITTADRVLGDDIRGDFMRAKDLEVTSSLEPSSGVDLGTSVKKFDEGFFETDVYIDGISVCLESGINCPINQTENFTFFANIDIDGSINMNVPGSGQTADINFLDENSVQRAELEFTDDGTNGSFRVESQGYLGLYSWGGRVDIYSETGDILLDSGIDDIRFFAQSGQIVAEQSELKLAGSPLRIDVGSPLGNNSIDFYDDNNNELANITFTDNGGDGSFDIFSKGPLDISSGVSIDTTALDVNGNITVAEDLTVIGNSYLGDLLIDGSELKRTSGNMQIFAEDGRLYLESYTSDVIIDPYGNEISLVSTVTVADGDLNIDAGANDPAGIEFRDNQNVVKGYINFTDDISDGKMDMYSLGPLSIGSDISINTTDLTVDGNVIANSIDTLEISNTAGDLKIQPDVQGDVILFGDTDVGNDETGKEFRVWRRAPEGNDYIRMYIAANKAGYIHTSAPLTLQSQVPFTINSVTDDITFKVGDNAGAKKFYFKDSDGTDVAIIDSDGNSYFGGNVGIGTISPDYNLHIVGNDTEPGVQIERIDNIIGIGYQLGTLIWKAGEVTPSEIAQMRVTATENWNATSSPTRFSFRTAGAGSTSPLLRMSIDESGLDVHTGNYLHDGTPGFTGTCINVTYSGGIAVSCND